MQPLSASAPPEPPAPPPPEPACPICRGRLAPLRGGARCLRCSYTFCEGCEGGPPDYGGPGGD